MEKPDCSVPGCPSKAKFRCPSCIKLGMIDNSYFCSKDCFQQFWNLHKIFHTNFKEAQSKPNDQLPLEFKNYSFTGDLRPWKQSPRVLVDDKNIIKPDYALSGVSIQEETFNEDKEYCVVETEEDKNDLRECSLIARKALDLGHSLVEVGVTTEEINDKVHDFIIQSGGYPSPLNYYNFPKSLCSSINEVICHGIPDKRPLQKGDIVNLDITVYFKGFHSDLNETFIVGETDPDSAKLIACAYQALDEAIKICKPGVLYRHIGKRIGEVVGKYGFSIVKTYCGHGVGEVFHSLPNVSHYPNNKDSGIMKEGHVFTIEPMINAGGWKDTLWPDNWTAATKDGKRSAQFEHTLLVTHDGVEVLTKRLESSPPLKFFDYNMLIQ
jgi:methionyl aminopeptidase